VTGDNTRRARLRLVDGRLYHGRVEHNPGFVRLIDGARLSAHLDGYVARPVANTDFPRRRVEWIRWEDAA
jgi:hypothetical protein